MCCLRTVKILNVDGITSITWGSFRKYDALMGGAKGVRKCTRGRGSEGLSVSALFEKFLIIVIVVFPLLIVRVILSEVMI